MLRRRRSRRRRGGEKEVEGVAAKNEVDRWKLSRG